MTYVRQGEYGLDPDSVSDYRLWIRIIPKCNGDFLVQGYMVNFHEDPLTLSRDISQIVEKMPYLTYVEESFKKFRDLEADDFQNLTLCTYTSVIKFREDPFNRVANAGHYVTYLAKVKSELQTQPP